MIGVNKMDCDTAGYKQARFDEIAKEMKNMLVKVGWKKDFIDTVYDVLDKFCRVPERPISAPMPSNPCVGKVFTVEMHHMRVDFANPGDNVGLNIKGLDKQNMPRSGDV